MTSERYLVTLVPSGDKIVIEEHADGLVSATSIALHVNEWSDDGGYTPKPNLELYDFDLEPLDEPVLFHHNDITYLYGPDGDMR